MTKDQFRQLTKNEIVILDGATATELSKHGMPSDCCPEQWIVDNPDILKELQSRYSQNGSKIIYTPTFGANGARLREYGLEGRVTEFNENLASLTRQAVGDRLVFGNISTSGIFIKPLGESEFEDVVNIYTEQVKALIKANVDGFAVETVFDVQEARAALLAVKECCDLPVMVSMTFRKDGTTWAGGDPLSALVALQSMGADAFGCNCSTGPVPMQQIVRDLKPYATVPLLAKPNACEAKPERESTGFELGPEEFAAQAVRLVEMGVNLIGGCCGTGPEHIGALSGTVKKHQPIPPKITALSAVSSSHRTRLLDFHQPFAVIGERINPTGKKDLQAELRKGSFGIIKRFSREQAQKGAAILDVNMGLSGINEKEMMLNALNVIVENTDRPLCIDTSDPYVMEAALRHYPGRALVNSISAEKKKVEKMLPLAAKYGAMFILLPLTDDGIPQTRRDRIKVVEDVFQIASGYGYHTEDITVDGLIMTISSNQDAANVSLDLVDWARHQFGSNTVFGLSNVSFGMPQRKWINATFLGMAIGRGLTMAIANPSSELLMETVRAGNLVRN